MKEKDRIERQADAAHESLDDADSLVAKLKIKKPTVRLWTRTTDMPRIRVGRLVRFRYSDVIRWLESR